MRIAKYVGERTQVGSGHYEVHLRVEVQNASGVWVDYTAAGGRNYVDRVTLTASIDQPVMSGTVTFARAQYDGTGVLQSLAPFLASGLNVDGSGAYAPALNPGRQIRVSCAAVAPGASSATISAAMRVLVVGKVDAVSWEADPITVTFRDLSAFLLDAMIESAGIYGADDGTQTAEQVIQAILDAWPTGGGTLTLYTPVPSAFAIRQYQQDPGPLLEALRAIAMQRGWDVRYAFDAADAFRLTFFEPDRAKTVADFTLPPSEYLTVSAMSVDDADVRNVVEVVYTDAASGTPGQRVTNDLTRPATAGSIAQFHRRFMRLVEAASTNIDTAAEATALAEAAAADLATPLATHAVTSLLLPFVELGDVVAFPANSTHYDNPQQLAVVGYTHDFGANGPGSARTTLQTRGKPAGAYREWLEREGGAIPVGVTAPAPEWGPLYGEGSSYGGTEPGIGGAVWQAVTLDANTARVVGHSEQTPPPGPAPTPDIGDNATRAFDIPRPEGAIGKRPRVTMYKRMATPAGYAVTFTGYGVGLSPSSVNGGEQRSPLTTRQALAVDVASGIEPGALASLSVARAGTSNVLTIARAASPTPASPYPILCFIYRDGVNIDQVAPPAVGTPLVYSDNDLDADKAYTYQVHCWSQGVSGPRLRWQADAPVPQPDPTTTVPATNPPPPVSTDPVPSGDPPVWADIAGVPTPFYDGASDEVDFAWTCADPAADSIGVEFWDGRTTTTWHAAPLSSQTGTAAAGTAVGGNAYASGYYRLVSLSATAVRLAVSVSRYFRSPYTATAPGAAL